MDRVLSRFDSMVHVFQSTMLEATRFWIIFFY